MSPSLSLTTPERVDIPRPNELTPSKTRKKSTRWSRCWKVDSPRTNKAEKSSNTSSNGRTTIPRKTRGNPVRTWKGPHVWCGSSMLHIQIVPSPLEHLVRLDENGALDNENLGQTTAQASLEYGTTAGCRTTSHWLRVTGNVKLA